MRRQGSIAMGVAAVIAAAPAQAQDTKPPRPQIDVQPRTVTYGDTALLTGSLVNGAGDAGVPVALLRRAVPAEQVYHEVARMPAGPRGDIRFSLQPTGNAYYAVRTRSEPVQTSLGLLVRVTPAVELRVPQSRVRRGRRVRFAGTVRPDLAGTPVRIQRRTSGGFQTVARTRLVRAGDDTSAFGIRIAIRRAGTYRVSVPASGTLSDGSSSARHIRVRG